MATLSDITSKITSLTGASTTNYTNAERLIDINMYYDRAADLIVGTQDEVDFDDSNNTTFPIYTANTVANQADYSIPSGVIQVKRVEVSYDGSNYYKAEPIDIGERSRDLTQTSINNDFSESTPFYDIQYNSVFLYPIPTSNVTSGIKIWGTRNVTHFTSSDLTTGTATPGFDKEFHLYLAFGPAYEYARSKGLSIAEQLKRDVVDFEARIARHYGKKNKDRHYSLGSAYIDYE